MAKNADTVVDDDKEVTEEDLRSLKYGSDGVETSEEADETDETEEDESSEEAGDEDGKTGDEATEETEETDQTESDDETSEYVKEFPNIKGDTLEDYTKNLELTIRESSNEGKRLSDRVKELEAQVKGDKTEETTEAVITNPLELYMKQKMDEEINTAFTEFSKEYSQVNDAVEYDKFTKEVATFSQAIQASQNRLAPPRELYRKAAVSLGWESNDQPNGKEKVGMAVKRTAAVSKTTSGTSKAKVKSKVTDQMIAVNRMMYPGKSDQEIREELEPHIQ